ncbi:hypothetical protein MRX96_033917 [Rhipicephalus microplus]
MRILTATTAKKRRSSWMLKRRPLKGGAEEDAEGYDHTDADAWEGAAYSADSEIAEGVTDVEYYVGEGTIRNGKWDEMQGVDADDAKVVLDVDDVPIAKDERAAKVSDDTEKFKKVVRREAEEPGKPMLGSCKKPSASDTTMLSTAEFSPGLWIAFQETRAGQLCELLCWAPWQLLLALRQAAILLYSAVSMVAKGGPPGHGMELLVLHSRHRMLQLKAWRGELQL